MGPRVREDDSVRELIRTPSCHSRACGDPFIHTCQKPRLEMHSPRQTTTKAKPTATPTMKCEKRATALAIRWIPAFARMTKIRNEKAELSSAAKNKKTQRTAATPPTVISAYTGDPFICTCQKPRLETHLPRQTTTKAKPTTTPAMKR